MPNTSLFARVTVNSLRLDKSWPGQHVTAFLGDSSPKGPVFKPEVASRGAYPVGVDGPPIPANVLEGPGI